MAQQRRRPAPAPLPAATITNLDAAAVEAVASWDGNPLTWSPIRVALGVEFGESAELSAAITTAWRARRRRVLLAEG